MLTLRVYQVPKVFPMESNGNDEIFLIHKNRALTRVDTSFYFDGKKYDLGTYWTFKREVTLGSGIDFRLRPGWYLSFSFIKFLSSQVATLTKHELWTFERVPVQLECCFSA